MKHLKILTMTMTIAATATLMGCANTSAKYEPIVDGAKLPQYSADLEACQTVATQKSFTNGDVKTEAAIGAAIGAVIGAIEEGTDGAIGGVIAGGIIGGGDRAWDVREERKEIVVSCMRQRGHKAVG